MPSERQLAANRANALKSRGPVTPEGKARSAANARVIHGLASPERAALSAVLRNENRDTFLAFHQALIEEHIPATVTEHIIVREMAVADWRLHRARAMETALLDNQMDLMAAGLESDYASIDHATRAALAFQKSVEKSNSLPLLIRYTGRLEREAGRTRHELAAYRAAQLRLAAEAEKVQEPGEPNPEIEHSAKSAEEELTNHDDHGDRQLPTPEPPLSTAQLPSQPDNVEPAAAANQRSEPPPSAPAMEDVPEPSQRGALRDPGRIPSPLPRAA